MKEKHHHKDGHHAHHAHHASHHKDAHMRHEREPGGNPDKGPPMVEGAMHFNKGYVSDDEHFDPKGYPSDHERGNRYMHMQNEVVHRDSKKLESSKFSKIA